MFLRTRWVLARSSKFFGLSRHKRFPPDKERAKRRAGHCFRVPPFIPRCRTIRLTLLPPALGEARVASADATKNQIEQGDTMLRQAHSTLPKPPLSTASCMATVWTSWAGCGRPVSTSLSPTRPTSHVIARDGRSVANDDNARWLKPAFAQIHRILKSPPVEMSRGHLAGLTVYASTTSPRPRLKACGDHVDAVERFMRRFVDYLGDPRQLLDSSGRDSPSGCRRPTRAA